MADSVRDSVTKAKLIICPYCGQTQPLADRCRSCGGLFEPLSRQATHNSMGPWFIRDENRPFQPGCSFETILRLIERGKITSKTIMRGPTTRQFWTIAKRVPGVSHRLGACHDCEAAVNPDDQVCPTCGAAFVVHLDRNSLGLPEYRPLPWEQPGDQHVAPPAGEGVAMTWSTPRPAAPETGGTISSFATDKDVTAETPGNGTPPDANSAPPEREPASPSPAAAEADAIEAITMRTLRRRLVLQQKSQQRQKVLLFIVGALALVALIGWTTLLFNRSDVSTDAEEPRQPAATPPASASPAGGMPAADNPSGDAAANDTQVDDGPEDGSPPGGDADSSLPDLDTPDAASTLETDAPPPTLSAADRAELDAALEKLSFSRDESQSLADRIAACKEALAMIAALAEQFAPGALPGEIERRRQEATRQLERLRLREFFP